MRFLLYNIRYGAGIGRQFHLPVPYSGYLKHTNGNFDRITEFIKSVHPDIIGLVEVDGGSYRTDRCNQAETIAAQMQHVYVYESKYHSTSVAQKVPVLNKQGNAILTNQQIKSKRFRYFRDGVKRLVIELELEELTVFLVHLSVKSQQRYSQLQDLRAMVQTAEKPVIVAGDFNVLWGDRELQSFQSETGLINVNYERKPSHPSRAPHRELDFIFCSREIKPGGFETPQIKLSDHIPLIFDFQIVR